MATNPIAQALSPFIWGRGGAALTPEQVAREREVAEALMAQGIDTSPVGHWTQGAARMANVLAGKLKEGRANKAESAGRAEISEKLSSLFGGSPSTSTAMAAAPAPDYASARVAQTHGVSGPQAYRDAIASIESKGSGDYAAVGPKHSKLGRALGRYQVMEANIGPWSEKHLGRRVTADEFMANPAIQDAIFDAEFGSYVDRFGDPAMAAQAWFAGPGGVGTNRKDSLGTSVPEYASKFNAALARLPAVAANEAMATGSLAGVPVAETEQEILAQEAAMAAQDPMAFQRPVAPLAEPRMVNDMPVADIAQSLTRATVNPDLPMAGNTSGFLPVAQSLAAQPQQQGGMPNMQQLIELASDPWATDAQRGVVQALLQQQMQAQDPMRQLQMQKAQLEIEAMRNPAQKPIEVGGVLLDPSTMQPIFDSRDNTPSNVREYEYYANAETAAGRQPMPFGDWDQSRRRSGATNVTTNVGGENLTPGQKKIDEAFADTYLQWQSGGYADSAKQLDQLNESLGIIENAAANGDNISGVIGALPTSIQPFINPQGTIAREGVEEVVQRSLREILGAQFTEKEGERLIARAYNPLLPPVENAKRVRRLIGQVQGMAEARQAMVDYFDNEGTLRGFKGKRPSLSQLENIESEWEREDNKAGREFDTGQSGVIQPGTVQDGYRFKGGDPANPNNWEKQ